MNRSIQFLKGYLRRLKLRLLDFNVEVVEVPAYLTASLLALAPILGLLPCTDWL